MSWTTRSQRCAMGIDSGMANTGVGVVTDQDYVLHASVLHPPAGLEVVDKIWWLHRALRALVIEYQPCVIGIETYTAPARRVRAQTARRVPEHNWLIGACLMLTTARVPLIPVQLLEATIWMHQLTGVPSNRPIGTAMDETKGVIRRVVEQRTGHVFVRNSGGHQSDACGMALVALDNVKRYGYAQEGCDGTRCV